VLLIVGAAHFIAITTALATASLASDAKVASGGDANVLARSLGAAAGATVAMAQIAGLALLATLSAVAVAETVVPLVGLASLPKTLRLMAIACLVGLSVIPLLRKSLAYGSGYLAILLGLVALVSVITGLPTATALHPTLPPPGALRPLASPFALVFPLVAGIAITASRANDAQEPRRTVPRALLLATFAALALQGGFVMLLVTRVPAEILGAPGALEIVARMPTAVTAGVLAVGLGGAVVAMVGAARSVQSIAADGIVPRALAEGSSTEPRRALLVVLALAVAGVFVGDLDAVARLASLVLLAAFAVSNLAHALLRLASPTFRPSFPLPSIVSLVAAGACVFVMVHVDARATIAAAVLAAASLLLLAYRRFTRDADGLGDGIWAALVRSGLARLSRVPPRRFRPNVLMFRSSDEGLDALREIGVSLTRGGGVLTELTLASHGTSARATPTRLGVFQKKLRGIDPFEAIPAAASHHGFAGLEPNTVLLDWPSLEREPARLETMLAQLAALDLNILLHAPDGRLEEPADRRIDIWWKPDGGNVPLCLALVRLLDRDAAFRGAQVRFMLISTKSASNEQLRSTMGALLREADVDATFEIIDQRLRAQTTEELISSGSADALLTIIGLPNDSPPYSESFHARAESLHRSVHGLLMVHGSSEFEPVLQASGRTTRSLLPPPVDGGAEIPPLELPADPRIAATVARVADGYERLAERLFEDCIEHGFGRDGELVRRIKVAAEGHFSTLEKNLTIAGRQRRKKTVNRFHSSLLMDCGRLLEEFVDRDLDRQGAVVTASIATALSDPAVARGDARQTFAVEGATEGGLFRLPATQRVPVGRLERFYFERAIDELILPTLRSFVTSSHQLMAQLGRLLSAATLDLGLSREVDLEDEALARVIAERKREFLARLDALVEEHAEETKRREVELVTTVRRMIQDFAADADRVDAEGFARRQRRVRAAEANARRGEIERLQRGWAQAQRLVLDRARLGLELATFQHRLLAAMAREKAALSLAIESGLLGECERLREALVELHRAIAAEPTTPPTMAESYDLFRRFDADAQVERLTQTARQLAAELPHSTTTLTDDALENMLHGQAASVETVEVPVLRLAEFLVETKLIGPLQAVLEGVPQVEQRAAGVAQDVIRLVKHQLSELADEDERAETTVAEQLDSVVEHGRMRIEDEIERLRAVLARALQVLDDQLTAVTTGTNAYGLTTATSGLEQLIRRRKGEKAISLARSLLDRGASSLDYVFENLLYRRSEALLIARERTQEATRDDALVERITALVARYSPSDEVIADLPFYYRQLFIGQGAINDAFWVGRKKELETGRRALAAFDQGCGGAIVITGERGSGKTALTLRITSSDPARRQVFRLFPSRGGSTSLDHFGAALRQATGLEGPPERVLDELPDGSMLALDDFEMWWARDQGGLAVVDCVLSLIERFGKRILFVLTMSRQAYAFINRLRPLTTDAIAVIDCGPVPAAELRDIIMLRHASTGLRFELAGRGEEDLGKWRQARLFSAVFDATGGMVGPALRSWLAQVRTVSDGVLRLEASSRRGDDVIDALPPESVALLLQLVLHKQLGRARLVRIAAESRVAVERDLERLVRMRLVTETPQQVLEINPFIQHVIVDRFARRGLVV
jgi:amino acid transporter